MYVCTFSLWKVEYLRHKVMKKFCVSSEYFGGIFRNIEKLLYGRCFLFPLHVFWDIINNTSNVVNNGSYWFAWWGVSDGHTKIFLYFTLHYGHFLNISI